MPFPWMCACWTAYKVATVVKISSSGPKKMRQVELPGTCCAILVQWFTSFAFQLNILSQKCNIAFQSLLFTKHTGLNTKSPLPFYKYHLAGGCCARMLHSVSLRGASSAIYFTVTVEASWMDSITAAKRLQRSYGELGRIFGGSFSITTSVEPSRRRGSSSPSLICRLAAEGGE